MMTTTASKTALPRSASLSTLRTLQSSSPPAAPLLRPASLMRSLCVIVAAGALMELMQ